MTVFIQLRPVFEITENIYIKYGYDFWFNIIYYQIHLFLLIHSIVLILLYAPMYSPLCIRNVSLNNVAPKFELKIILYSHLKCHLDNEKKKTQNLTCNINPDTGRNDKTHKYARVSFTCNVIVAGVGAVLAAACDPPPCCTKPKPGYLFTALDLI